VCRPRRGGATAPSQEIKCTALERLVAGPSGQEVLVTLLKARPPKPRHWLDVGWAFVDDLRLELPEACPAGLQGMDAIAPQKQVNR
jgi:hypothetical protein